MVTTASSIGAAISAAAGTVNESRIEVTDGSGATRVWLGALGANEYGLKVVSSDGETVIIDGTSNMFKIAATGTLSGTKTTGSDAAVETVTLTGLGTMSVVPAHLVYVSTSLVVTTTTRVLALGLGETQLWAASESGGPVDDSFLAMRVYARLRVYLSADPGYPVAAFWINNHSGSDATRYCRYYILQEAGI